jgi:hypothetical protein
MHETEKSGDWIILARSRLAQRRAEKAATKAGQIKALWPEIDAALAGGQTMKSIRKWLEEDAGISLGITSLTSYISRLRRREKANRRIEGPAAQSVRVQTRVEPVPAPVSARPPISTPRQSSSATITTGGPARPGYAGLIEARNRYPRDPQRRRSTRQEAYLTKGKHHGYKRHY